MDTNAEHPAASELIRHAAWLKRLARALVGDVATADDLVQETFVAALSRPPPDGRMPRRWLARVVRNAAKQTFRSQGRRARREADSAGPAPLPGPRETVERLDTERCLTEELARLDEPFRTALMLRYYDGLAPAEIATRTGTPGGTIRWRLQRGLELLRERLDGRFGERTTWCALLLHSACPPPLAAAGAAASTSVLQGVLTMSAFWKLGAAVACLSTITIGLMFAGILPSSILPSAHDAPLEVAFRPLPSNSSDTREEKTFELPALEAAREVVQGTPSAPVATPDPGPAPARVEARVVDDAGLPLAGVELRRPDEPSPAAHSASDGQVVLSLAVDPHPRGVALEFRSPGYASRGFTPVLAAGEVAYLGTVALGPGGVISGRVLDAAGTSVQGARVAFESAIETSRALEKRRVPGGLASLPMTHSDAQGRFELVGLGTGFVRVCAEAQGFLVGFTPPVEVRPGQETYGIELKLDALPPENRLRGVVHDPHGAPLAHATIEFRYESRASGTTSSGERTADVEGRFEFRLPNDALACLTARDPAGRFATASVTDVRTGGPELVLQLAEAPRLALVVRGAEGPIEEYGFEVLAADQRSVHQREPRARRPNGAAEFQRPASAFVVAIDAPGYVRELLGPFEPARVALPLEARLAAVPGLRGRVRLGPGGAPAVGARMRLFELVPDDVEHTVDGFPSRLQRGAIDEAVCDAEGAFLLTVRRSGEYVVRAERAEHAPAESTAITVAQGLGAPEVELVLTAGGAIEGRVQRADGGDPAGTILGLSRGDGFGRTLRVGPDGRYRIEHLTPGPWWIDVRSAELEPGKSTASTISGRKRERAVEPTCRVFEGETTWHDLELGGDPVLALEGCLRVDGEPARAWKVRLIPRELAIFQDETDGIGLDIDGCFRVETKRPGDYWLVLSGAFEQHGDQVVVDVVQITPAVARWEQALRTGALVVEGAAAWDSKDVPTCMHHWKGPGELFSLTVIAGNEAGVARVASVASGPGRLVRPDPTHFDFAKWPTLLEVEVPAGGEARVRLP